MTDRLDFTATWDETRQLLRSHGEGVGAIAGAMLFLPDWVANMFMQTEQLSDKATISEVAAQWQAMAAANWYILLPAFLCSLLGTVALYVLLARSDLPKIGDAIRAALVLLPTYFLAQLLSGLIFGLGLLVLILPGLYLIGRFAPLGAVIATGQSGVIGSIERTLAITRGNGWVSFLLLFLVMLVAFVVLSVASLAIKLPLALVVGPEGIPLVTHALGAFSNMVFSVITVALSVAIYRQLTAQPNI